MIGRDGVDIGGVGGEGQLGALAAGGDHHGVEQLVDALQALESFDGIQRFQPILALKVVRLGHG